jgi:cytoskeletal protein RodZ
LSLIDEALKRARVDAARTDVGPRGGPYPWLPTQLAGARRSRRALLTGLLAGGLGVALLLGVAVFVWLPRRQSPANAAPEPAAAQVPPAVSAPEAPAPGEAAEQATAGSTRPRAALGSSVAASERVADDGGGRRGGAAASIAAAAPPAVAATDPHPPAAPPRAAAAIASRPEDGSEISQPPAASPPATPRPEAAPSAAPPPEEGKEYVRSAELPAGRLVLSGIAYSETQPVAVLNGRIVGPGEIIAGFTVVKIQPDRVLLRGAGVNIVLLLN